MRINMISARLAVCLTLIMLVAAIAVPATAGGKKVQLWGKQIAGTGPGSNARQEGNKIEVTSSAKITKVQGTAESYCIWKVGGYRGFLCGGKGRASIIGKELPAGTYIVRAGLTKRQRSAQVTITLALE